MAKVKLTKNEQKKQKDALKRFTRYLPTLQLKKQQLQMVIRQVESEIEAKRDEIAKYDSSLSDWIRVFGEETGIGEKIRIKEIEKDTGNIAGVDIPVFKKLDFEPIEYDLFTMPLWVDRGIVTMKELAALNAEIEVLLEQKQLLDDELRTTNQRVNLFEKVKIPETKEIIRKIGIYLGDQQTAAVVRGKIAKGKVVKEA
ncbi:MAG: V-type ATP synthase subunit D [Spirochaetales bacterium]|uniref:V-type ATP synthase subunit D n=1 Tax=Candidatus Thalassospirochaeta sargassi TaxID=3119039 RepID=A0AAJ1MKV1_9SPIO|nr:V-type ATP synthase subunit D [Spirochaetales bacterium]